MEEETSTLQSRAQQLLRKRVDAIGALETAMTELTDARAAVAVAEQQMSDALKAATNAGWTTNELRELGLPVSTGTRSRSGKRAGKSASRASAGSAPRTTPEPPPAAAVTG